MVYEYPYYSDEWYAIAFIKDSIENKSLPLNNPFSDKTTPFVNMEAAFHSLLAEIMLFLGLDPLLDYTLLTIFINSIIILIGYFIAKNITGNVFASFLSSFSILFITSSSNLPGIWHLLPVNIGVLLLLLTIYFSKKEQLSWVFFSSFLTLIFYPPFIIFLIPLFAVKLLKNLKNKKELLHVISNTFFVIVSASLIVGAFYFLRFLKVGNYYYVASLLLVILSITPIIIFYTKPKYTIRLANKKYNIFIIGPFFVILIYLGTFLYDTSAMNIFIKYIVSKIKYNSFALDAIPNYKIYEIVFIPTLLFLIFGIKNIYENHKDIFYMIITGFLFWLFYSMTDFRFIIDYQRVVFATSVIISIASSSGVSMLSRIIKVNNNIKKYVILFLFIFFFIFIYLSLISYTKRENWKKLTLTYTNPDTGQEVIFLPSAPANNYLIADDLRIFSKLNKKRFLAPGWKGTVIGTATDNIPVTTKPGTISINNGLFYRFFISSCTEKEKIVKEYSISYIYSPEFLCDNFVEIDESVEGLHLYKYDNKK